MLSVNNKGTDWDIKLLTILWCLNTTAVSVSHSPYLLVFGRLPFYPHTRLGKPDTCDTTLRSEIFRDILHTQELLYEDTNKQLERTSHRMKQDFDRNK